MTRAALALLLLPAGCVFDANGPAAAASDGAPGADATACEGFVRLAAGGRQSCVLDVNGLIRCWGADVSATPLPVLGVPPALAIAVGDQQACALGNDGSVWCWNAGKPPGVQPVPAGVVDLTVGQSHTCVRTALGAVTCFGDNSAGQLGIGVIGQPPMPMPVLLPRPALDVDAGALHTCALLDDGRIMCWGRGLEGQLGDGGASASAPSPVEVADVHDADRLAVGAFHGCARRAGRKLWCWGHGGLGQLGDGQGASQLSPVEVTLPAAVLDADAGDAHTCARLEDGRTFCWGLGEDGQLGVELRLTSPTPIEAGVPPLATLALGAVHSCALTTLGEIICWGSNSQGQLGNDGPTDRLAPVATDGTLRFVAIDAGLMHTCALTDEHQLYCWGDGAFGQLGLGDRDVRTTPTLIDVPGVTAVAAGQSFTCALDQDHAVWCFGSNAIGQLGDGSLDDRLTAVHVLDGADAIEAGGAHACAHLQNGELACWGNNDSGQLALDPDLVGYSMLPVTLPASLGDLAEVALGAQFSCARGESGLFCWGRNLEGQLGDGTLTNHFVPSAVASEPLLALSAGLSHICGIDSSSGPKCWGANASGELGFSAALGTYSSVPVPAGGAGLQRTMAAGGQHTCAIDSINHVTCWGRNSRGQLGSGTRASEAPPSSLAGGSWRALAGGFEHTCGLDLDGAAWCWGGNERGQLGDGTRSASPVPVAVPLQCPGG